jgi:hypothetical protein
MRIRALLGTSCVICLLGSACGAKTTLELGPGAGEGVQCAGVLCGETEACGYCPGGFAHCVPASSGAPFCPGALVVACDAQSDCDTGNQCVLRFSGQTAEARCMTLDLPCSSPACERVCASDDECYPGERCESAVLKYGAIDVCG